MTEAPSLPQDLDPLLQLQVWLLRSYGFLPCAYRAQSYCHMPQEGQTTICQSFPSYYPLKFLVGMLPPSPPGSGREGMALTQKTE